MKLRFLFLGMVTLSWLPWTLAAGGLVATLAIDGPGGKKEVRSVSGTLSPREKRLIIGENADDQLNLHWTMRNTGVTRVKDVLIHFFVAEEDRAGQLIVPDLKSEKVVMEGAVTMDFGPTNSASGNLSFKIHAPGSYLVRVEVQPDKDSVMELPVAAMDLNIK